MRKPIIGVMGPGKKDAQETDTELAFEVGRYIAKEGWMLLSGGTSSGVMGAVNKGAKKEGGFTVGILPHPNMEITEGMDIPIITDIRSARNTINILTSDVIIAVGISAGTTTEIAFSLQSWASKNVILLNCSKEGEKFFSSLRSELVHIVEAPEEAIKKVKEILNHV